MKQHITKVQLNELSGKGKVRLFKWITEKGYARNLDVEPNPLLSIGQMIEFLVDSDYIMMDDFDFDDNELCDTLWQATKEELEK